MSDVPRTPRGPLGLWLRVGLAVVLPLFGSFLLSAMLLTAIWLGLHWPGPDPEAIQKLAPPNEEDLARLALMPLVRAGLSVAAGISAAVSAVLLVRVVDRGRLARWGWRGASPGWRGAAWGMLGGGVIAAVVLLAITALGGRHLRPADLDGYRWSVLLLPPAFLFLAWAEEWLLHGYLFQRVGEVAGAARAILITAMAFAILHVTGPGGGFLAAINGLLLGVVLGQLRLLTGGIETGVGLRLGWTLVLGVVLGGKVEGYELPALVRAGTDSLDPLLGGGGYGPEASVVATGLLLLLVGLLLRPLLPAPEPGD